MKMMCYCVSVIVVVKEDDVLLCYCVSVVVVNEDDVLLCYCDSGE